MDGQVANKQRRASDLGTIRSPVVKLPGLQRQRMLAALTQEDLAERAGVQRPTITRLERGGEARPHTIRKLAEALGCTPRDLIEPSERERGRDAD